MTFDTFENRNKEETKRTWIGCWQLLLLPLQDVLKFGFSTREYVILTEKSQDKEDDLSNEEQ